MIFSVTLQTPFEIHKIYVEAESKEQVFLNKGKIEEAHVGLGRVSKIAKPDYFRLQMDMEEGIKKFTL